MKVGKVRKTVTAPARRAVKAAPAPVPAPIPVPEWFPWKKDPAKVGA